MSEMPPKIDIDKLEFPEEKMRLAIKMAVQTEYMYCLGFIRKDELENFDVTGEDEFNQEGGRAWVKKDAAGESYAKQFSDFFDENYNEIIKTPEAKRILSRTDSTDKKKINIFIILFEKYLDEFKARINFSFKDHLTRQDMLDVKNKWLENAEEEAESETTLDESHSVDETAA